MTRVFIMCAGALLTLGMLSGAGALADEEKLPLDKVPAPVLKAAKAKFPKAEVKGAAKEEEGGKITYEIMMKDGAHNIDLSLKADGTILVIEKEIAAKDLPKAVADAVKAKYPKGKIEKSEELTEGTKITFEVVLAVEGKKSFELVLDPKGKIIEDGGAETKEKK
jgi:hypothetical protein